MISGGESAPPSNSSPRTASPGSVPSAAGSSTPCRSLRRVNFLMVGIPWNVLRFGPHGNDCSTGLRDGNGEVCGEFHDACARPCEVVRRDPPPAGEPVARFDGKNDVKKAVGE